MGGGAAQVRRVCGAAGHALAVVEVLLPADRHEVEDAYPIG
jgi:hypothetical protein